jgi:HK97 family phage prohead protease
MNCLTIKSINSELMHISGYASVFNNVDDQGDVILNGAFGEDISSNAKNVKLLWQHNPVKPLGVISLLQEDSYGLLMEAAINLKTWQGQEASELLKQGAVNSLSIGFHIKSAKRNSLGHREISALNLWEVSIVTFPANPKAQINYITKQEPKEYSQLHESLIYAIRRLQLIA